MSTSRAISIVLLTLSAGLAVWVWLVPQLTIATTYAMYAALLVVGPMLSVLDKMHTCIPQWLYHTETLLRNAIITAILLRFAQPSWAVLSILSIVVLLVLFNHTDEDKVVIRDTYMPKLGFVAMLVMWVACGAWSIMTSTTIAPFPNVMGLVLFSVFFSMMFLAIRDDHYHSVDQRLNANQHRTLWPLLAKQRPHKLWSEIFGYEQKYGTFAPCMEALPMPVLLSFFKNELSSVFKESPHFIDALKSTINAREPRAQVFWEMYSAKEAATLIGQLGSSASYEPPDTLALPAL